MYNLRCTYKEMRRFPFEKWLFVGILKYNFLSCYYYFRPVDNLIKYCTTIIYNTSLILTRKLNVFRVIILGRRGWMFLELLTEGTLHVSGIRTHADHYTYLHNGHILHKLWALVISAPLKVLYSWFFTFSFNSNTW